MEHNATNICRTLISNKEQKLNKQVAELRISKLLILYVDFGQIQYFFKVLKTDFTIQYFFDNLSTYAQIFERKTIRNWLFTALRHPTTSKFLNALITFRGHSKTNGFYDRRTHSQSGDGSDGARPAVLYQGTRDHFQGLGHGPIWPLFHASHRLGLLFQFLHTKKQVSLTVTSLWSIRKL